MADQAVSSLTNFAVGIVVARSLGLAEFGAFSLAWVTYGVVLNLSRGLATDPLVVRFSAVAAGRWRAAVSRSSGTALVLGLVTGVGCAGIGLVVGGPIGAAFVGLGLALPAVALQDCWRFAFFAAGQPRRAMTNDLVRAAALVPAMFVVAESASIVGFMLAWGLSAAVAAGFGCLQLRLLPSVGAVRGWLREQRDLGLRYMIENVSSSGAAQLRMYGLGAIAGLAAVGTVRGAELLLGPFLTVLMGLSQVAVPEAARVLQRSPHRLSAFCLLLGGAQAVAALLWGLGLLLLLPDEIGEHLLHALWLPASALILPATLAVMNASFFTGAAAGLRALGAARRSLRAQLLASAGYVIGGLAGAAVAGALGSAWGVALGTAFGATVWWFQLRAGIAERTATTVSAQSPSVENEGTPAP
ncbi:hypothetical protein ACFQE5_21110 [Pseudonocardia hispaniensis]|uniref:O-antigen/teichoic acid export membrane protein n=1 Tax=Pseudonocardia hispaniensis TaxID=904933 RepID=A0ABW1J8H7_9PSEU